MEILSTKEEQKLSPKELTKYYQELRDYLKNTPHEKLSAGSLSVCEKISPLVRNTLKKFCGYEIIEEGNSKIEGLIGIYAHTHQAKFDHINFIATNPNHTILLNSIVLSDFYKKVLGVNGVYFVEKGNKKSQNLAKLEMIRLALNQKSVTIFPESAYNLSPNKLHLPLRLGIVDIARKSGVPIIPVVQEYIYDDSILDGIERVKRVYVTYGEPIYVKETDNPFFKLEEYSASISTMRWNIIEKKGQCSRSEIKNQNYINFIEGNKRNLTNAGISIDKEREGIFGAQDDFYLFHHINDLPYDENGNFICPEHVRKLIKLYDDHCLK